MSDSGQIHHVNLEKTEGKAFAVCKLENWEAGASIANPDQMKRNDGYFRDQADLCADYELDIKA